MGKRIGLEVSLSAAEAVKMANVDCIAAYPITPQTHIVEHLSELVNNGELDAEFIPVESEHSAMSVSAGVSAVGARAFTCTSSQGLSLMNEIVHIVASMRLPIVMILANRSMSGPISIWNDHTDVMSIRDCGWIQVFANNGQEVFDNVLFAYRVAESQKVMLPLIINIDGFILTHVIEPVEFWEKEQVKQYLPDFKPVYTMHPDRPVTMGGVGMPYVFSEAKVAQDEPLIQSKAEIITAWKELGDVVGRYYKPVETYRMEDAETLFVTQGSFGETVSLVVDALRDEGESVGLVMDRLWRPFPFDEFREATSQAKNLIVIDRAISYGGQGGPLAIDIRSALYKGENQPNITNFICGLAGRDVTINDFKNIYHRAMEKIKENPMEEDFEYYGVRGK
ncbi:MAG: pyruvate ferredoxin oxidoreductase [Deltaproteobacteria bacterium]|nr:pyruvate ferredoxin oxidoreductase [Deltaproteobacteria bacterium]MBW2104856.1 pyruvate ferredoxin oxidoreductase [Deltaproteobacteria bacterium]MBW2332104.1 pyruvate ferredoxin oxidoreductase [Deltaproteobacteria bacterium]HDH88382.1 pyruvate ferredoxin oxidoreductase [Desulfobacteraceae bacterium]